MYAVIFRAKIKLFDDDYLATVKRLRNSAINEYGCLEFTALSQDDNEISISYWRSLDDIKKWKADTSHLQAQRSGKNLWYENYHVQVVDVLREYGSE